MTGLSGDPELQAGGCSVQDLEAFAINPDNQDWIWPGDLNYVGLDDALSAFFGCTFHKAQMVTTRRSHKNSSDLSNRGHLNFCT